MQRILVNKRILKSERQQGIRKLQLPELGEHLEFLLVSNMYGSFFPLLSCSVKRLASIKCFSSFSRNNGCANLTKCRHLVVRTFCTNRAIGIKSERIRDVLNSDEVDKDTIIQGWVKTVRRQKRFSFLEVNDGSTYKNVQIVTQTSDLRTDISTGCSVRIKGVLASGRHGKEIMSSNIELVGACNSVDYPLQKKSHSNEFLREILHLRPRSSKFGAILRVRSEMSRAISDFFSNNDFVQIHTPLLTSNDCEGAGEMFNVTSTHDLFGHKRDVVHLTVSGQLHAEMFACALSRVYSFGPTFRAENSNTSRHLCEFWMLEPEVAFHDMNDSMDLAEDCVKFILNRVWESCKSDIDALAEESESSDFISDLELARTQPFERIDYDEAIKLLKNSSINFEAPVEHGLPLQSEHERYLSEIAFARKPVFVSLFPCETKPFYVKHCETNNGRRAKAMDLLLPRYGEVIGGSEREDSYQILKTRLEENNQINALSWYLDLRKYGSVPHSGWGLGFDRLLLFATGIHNIRDVVPVPRYPTSSLQY